MTWYRSSNLTLFCVLALALVCLSSSYLASAHGGPGVQAAPESHHVGAAPSLRQPDRVTVTPDTTAAALIPLTMSYYVTGGGSGFYPPTINYTANKDNLTTYLGNAPTTIFVDNGSTWYVHAYLPSYTIVGEQWATPAANDTGKVGNLPTSIVVHYTHQYYIDFAYQVAGGGSGFSGPAVTYTQFGTQLSLVAGSGAWVDAGTTYTYPSTLTGSTSSQRWTMASTSSTTGTATAPGLLTPTYYRQYAVTASYTVSGGTPPLPDLTYTGFGGQASQAIQPKGTTVWMDSDSYYSMAPSVAGASGERWIANSPPSGRLMAPQNISTVYYHQFFVAASYAVTGGGTPTPPAISFTSFGQTNATTLRTSAQSFWADAGSYSLTDPLLGSTPVQRWAAPNATGSVSSPWTLVFSYQRQYDIVTTGVQSGSQWVPARSNATVTEPGTFNRTGGTGERIISYSVDGGRSVGVTPTTGDVTIVINATSPHTIAFQTVAQYLVTLDPSTVQALATITPPTISGDSYWYDANSSVTVALHGAWGRTPAGTGNRLAQYTVNAGAPVPVATTNVVDAVSTSAISGPESIKAVVDTQYSFTTPEGPLFSTTLPTIPGDGLWYDSGTAVTATYNFVWNQTSANSRTNVLSYSVDGAAKTNLPRKASGTFAVSMTMSRAHTVQLTSVVQYLLMVSGGNGVAISAKSPTADGYYDSGTSLTVSTASQWNTVSGKSRENLVSYTLDGAEKSVPAGATGTFSPGALVLNAAQDVTFKSVTQYYVTFNFTDASGAAVYPSNFEIQTEGGPGVPVTGGGTWLANGTSFNVSDVTWEGADVTPTNGTAYAVHGPLSVQLPTRVYPLTIKATDSLGFPVSGATVELQLANGSQVSVATGAGGKASIAEIPLGAYKGTVSSVGLKTAIQGDASTDPQAQVKVLLSLPILAVVLGVVVAAVGGTMFVRRRARRAAASEGEQ